MKIAKRLAQVTPSVTLEITSLAKKMQAQGQRVVNFAAGEPDFDTPAQIKQSAVAALKSGFTKYTPSTGYPALKQLICQKLARDNQLRYSPNQIIVSCGAKHSLYNIFQVLCNPKDEVLISSPYWVSYPEMVKLAAGQVRILPTEAKDGFKLDPKLLAAQISQRSKILVLNSPANPTGAVYTRSLLKAIAEVAIQRNLYVISDEIYEKLIFDRKKHVSIATLNDRIFQRTIVVNGVSKTYAMTGFRIGYLACPQAKIIQALGNLQSHSTSNPCSISQWAASYALEKTKPGQINRMVAEFQSRRDYLIKGLAKIKGLKFVKPQAAFYLFCDISQLGLGSVALAQRLLREARIALIPGKAFGRDDYVRISFATSGAQIKEGLRRLKSWVENL